MTDAAKSAAALMRALAHAKRLLILCHLAEGETSVGELARTMEMRQPSLSQQLGRLRRDGLVHTRRNAKTIYYSLNSPQAEALIGLLYDLYCGSTKAKRVAAKIAPLTAKSARPGRSPRRHRKTGRPNRVAAGSASAQPSR